MPEGRRIFPNLTVEENLRVPIERAGPWTCRAHLRAVPASRASASRTAAGNFPAASRRCCRSRARCCSIRRLLILDEPSQGLAPLIVREVFRIVAQMRDEGISVLLVEQNVRMSLEIADHAYVLDNGAIVYSGPRARTRRRRGARPGAGRRQRRGMVDGVAATEFTMRVFITGANGFIGGGVATTLITAGHSVRGLVRDRAKAGIVAAHGIDRDRLAR